MFADVKLSPPVANDQVYVLFGKKKNELKDIVAFEINPSWISFSAGERMSTLSVAYGLATIPSGQFVTIGVTVSTAGAVAFYVNNLPVTNIKDPVVVIPFAADREFVLGSGNFQGEIKNVRIYNTEVSEQDAKAASPGAASPMSSAGLVYSAATQDCSPPSAPPPSLPLENGNAGHPNNGRSRNRCPMTRAAV